MADTKMTDEEIMAMGRKHGMAMLQDLKEVGATPGEMLGVASFAVKGLILMAAIKKEVPKEVVRAHFDEMLNVWLED